MNALVLTLFVSLLLAMLGLLEFAMHLRRGDHRHGDRLALLPLDDDGGATVQASSTAPLGDHRP
jgi:hypothetical protein